LSQYSGACDGIKIAFNPNGFEGCFFVGWTTTTPVFIQFKDGRKIIGSRLLPKSTHLLPKSTHLLK
jgi:hypothetical protein